MDIGNVVLQRLFADSDHQLSSLRTFVDALPFAPGYTPPSVTTAAGERANAFEVFLDETIVVQSSATSATKPVYRSAPLVSQHEVRYVTATKGAQISTAALSILTDRRFCSPS